jgi:integrase
VTTMMELFARYREERLPLLGARTQREVRHHLRALERDFGHYEAGTIRPKDVGRWMHATKAKQHRNKQRSVLSVVMNLAVGDWFIDGCDSNPCANVKKHPSKARDRYVTDEEFLAVRAMAKFPVQLAMDLALLTGQRKGDLLDLTWLKVYQDHIDITQGKTGKHLGIRITPKLAEVLQRARQYKPFVGPRLYLVRTRTGEPFTHEGFGAQWQRLMNHAMKTGVIRKRFTFHDLRAKCASDKKNLQGASALLGHSDQALTRRIYVRNIQMVDPGEGVQT